MEGSAWEEVSEEEGSTAPPGTGCAQGGASAWEGASAGAGELKAPLVVGCAEGEASAWEGGRQPWAGGCWRYGSAGGEEGAGGEGAPQPRQ